ncbi:MAG TPA: 6-phosphogluconolactonase, partial [Ferruginibacter sp.]|nr:6-phosphogluconolactonase [Ferruginibacter sp.]
AEKVVTIKTVWPDALLLAHAVAHLIVTESNKAVEQKEYFTIALSGGSTPKILFQLLAEAPYKNNIPWKKVIIAFGDERFVAPTCEESNYKMALDNLLSHVPIPKKNILAVPVLNLTPARSATLYEEQIRKYVSVKNPFDLVLLGIGEDGHTASIFPKSKLLTEKKRWVKEVWVAEKNMDRISFTLPFINQAKNIAFLISGSSKAAIVKKVFSQKGVDLPAAKVKGSKTLFWFLDEAANGSD